MPTNMSIDSDASDLGRGANHGADDASQLDTTSPSTDFAGDSTSGQLDGLSASGGANQRSKRERFDDTGFSTQSVHAGEQRQKAEGSISAPIFTASTFTFDSTDSLMRFAEGDEQRDEYGRYGTPNERTCEAKLAALEGAEEAIIYSSGMAAIVGLLMSRLNSGDEIVFFDQCYHRSREFCAKHLSRFGVVTRQVKK